MVKNMVKKVRKKGRIPEHVMVFQHNNLVEARYKLTLQEKRIVMWLASQLKPGDEDFKTHRITVKDFCNLISISPNSAYSEFSRIIKKLMNKIIEAYKVDTESIAFIPFLGYAEYYVNKGMIDLSFHPELKPFLLNLQKNFTAFSLEQALQFKSVHALRLYEILKKNSAIGSAIFEVGGLKKILGVQKDEYPKYANFKQRVLNTAQQEINEKSDILIEFEEIKEGRKVHEIEFMIKKNPNFGLSDEEKNRRALLQQLKQERKGKSAFIEEICELGFSKATVYKFLKQTNEESLRKALAVVNLQISKGQVRNPKALFKSALKNGWNI